MNTKEEQQDIRVINEKGEIKYFSHFMVHQTSIMKTGVWKIHQAEKPKVEAPTKNENKA